MKQLLEVLNLTAEHLKKAGIASPKREAEELLADAFNIPRMQLYLQFDRPVDENELTVCREKLKRRALGEPAAYIKGQVEFLDCQIQVTSDVLIPRPETEILADKIIQDIKKEPLQDRVLWDLCAGSGCIGLAIKKALPELKVILSDISPKACEIAKKNALANGLDVEVRCGDLFTPFSGEKAHYIVSNPPYISQKDYDGLDREVKEFEPKLALLAGESGTEVYSRFAEAVDRFWDKPGRLWFEIGYDQEKALLELFKGKGKVERDWAGHPRFFSLENE